ncbi:MAG: PTS sugar transporter subunit IIA [Caldisericaceae bacterium]|nr:PTS sugar transporter subunit IIA [Caldisericaceae bacterium]
MKLYEFLPVEHIEPDLKGQTKFQIIEELLDLLDKNGRLVDREVALQDVLAREGYLSTGLENGLAIPHAKTDGVNSLEIAFGVKKSGVDFESLDGKPAYLIFLVLSPRDTSGPHIQTLAVISRNLKKKEIRDMLLAAKTREEIFDIIKNRFEY